MEAFFQPIIANPLPPADYAHPAFAPMTISAMEGFLLGIILWRWSRSKSSIILLGFLINLATLALFWAAIRREDFIWEYDYQTVAIGEAFVVALEAIAMVFVVRKFSVRAPRRIWFKAFGLSLALNALSFFLGAIVSFSPVPTNKASSYSVATPTIAPNQRSVPSQVELASTFAKTIQFPIRLRSGARDKTKANKPCVATGDRAHG